jgi:endonuclease III
MHSSKTKQVVLVIEKLKKANPSSATSLRYRNAFQLLIAVMLSAQSTDRIVNKITKRLFRKYKTVKSLANAGLSHVEKEVYSSGFYKVKSRNIIQASKIILSRHAGKVPSDMQSLIGLPGVGRKTANIILSSAFNKAYGIAVDTHVGRISRRLGFSKSNNPLLIEKDLMNIVPYRYWRILNNLFVDFGRSTCTSRKPKCSKCLISALCPERNKYQ